MYLSLPLFGFFVGDSSSAGRVQTSASGRLVFGTETVVVGERMVAFVLEKSRPHLVHEAPSSAWSERKVSAACRDERLPSCVSNLLDSPADNREVKADASEAFTLPGNMQEIPCVN